MIWIKPMQHELNRAPIPHPELSPHEMSSTMGRQVTLFTRLTPCCPCLDVSEPRTCVDVTTRCTFNWKVTNRNQNVQFLPSWLIKYITVCADISAVDLKTRKNSNYYEVSWYKSLLDGAIPPMFMTSHYDFRCWWHHIGIPSWFLWRHRKFLSTS